MVLRRRDASGGILRLRKGRIAQSPGAPPPDAYAREVVAPLLGEAFVPRTQRVNVEPGFIAAAERNIAHVRPARRARAPLDLSATQCTLARDLTRLPGRPACDPEAGGGRAELPQLCFELKPKAALLPAADALDGAWPLPLCRFCALQLGRLRADPSYRPSGFCPLALFSGDRARVRGALQELVLRPQNNLGVFVDGALAYGKGELDAGRLLDVLEGEIAPLAAAAAPLLRLGSALQGDGAEPGSRGRSETSVASDLDELLGCSTGAFCLAAQGSEAGSVARRQDADDALSALSEHRGLQALLPEIEQLRAERARAALPAALGPLEPAAAHLAEEEAGAERLATHGALRLHLRAAEEVLLTEPLLAALSAAQAAADTAGIVAVRGAYERLLARCDGDERRMQVLVDSHARRLCGLAARVEAAPRAPPRRAKAWDALRRAAWPPASGARTREPAAAAAAADVALLHDWLLSLSLRDCSLMLCLTPLLPHRGAEEGAPPADGRGELRTVAVRLDAPDGAGTAEIRFAYSLGVVDLDLKPATKLPKHAREARAAAELAAALGIGGCAGARVVGGEEGAAAEVLRAHMRARPCARDASRGGRAEAQRTVPSALSKPGLGTRPQAQGREPIGSTQSAR